MGPGVPFVSNPFGAISPNKVVETETELIPCIHVTIAIFQRTMASSYMLLILKLLHP